MEGIKMQKVGTIEVANEMKSKKGAPQVLNQDELRKLQMEALLGRKFSDVAEERKAKRPTITPVQ